MSSGHFGEASEDGWRRGICTSEYLTGFSAKAYSAYANHFHPHTNSSHLSFKPTWFFTSITMAWYKKLDGMWNSQFMALNCYLVNDMHEARLMQNSAINRMVCSPIIEGLGCCALENNLRWHLGHHDVLPETLPWKKLAATL